MIDLMPNETFFMQLAIFLVTMLGLHFLVFRPALRLIAKREELTQGYQKSAEDLEAKTEALIADYEAKMKAARQEGLALKSEQTQAGEAQAVEILGKTREDLEAQWEEQAQAIGAQAKEAQLSLRKYSKDLSEEMAEKLLGRKVSA